MKRYWLPAFLFLYSCSTNSQPPDTQPQSENIRSVNVSSAGGQLGFGSFLHITPDSVYYLRHVNMAPEQNDSFSRANTPESWQALVNDLNLDSLRNAKDGPSVQPVDGIDTQITVYTDRDSVTKTNAHESPEWMQLKIKTEIYLQQ